MAHSSCRCWYWVHVVREEEDSMSSSLSWLMTSAADSLFPMVLHPPLLIPLFTGAVEYCGLVFRSSLSWVLCFSASSIREYTVTSTPASSKFLLYFSLNGTALWPRCGLLVLRMWLLLCLHVFISVWSLVVPLSWCRLFFVPPGESLFSLPSHAGVSFSTVSNSRFWRVFLFDCRDDSQQTEATKTTSCCVFFPSLHCWYRLQQNEASFNSCRTKMSGRMFFSCGTLAAICQGKEWDSSSSLQDSCTVVALCIVYPTSVDIWTT